MSNARPIPNMSPARNYVRAIAMRSLHSTDTDAQEQMLAERYGWVYDGVKSAVSDLDSSDTLPGRARGEFFDAVFSESIFGQVSGWHRVEFNQNLMRATTGATAYWTAQHSLVPITNPGLTSSTLERLKCAGLIVLTKEALQAQGEIAEAGVQRDLVAAAVGLLNSSFLDSTNAGVSGESPASVTNSLAPAASTSDPAADIRGMIEDFSGDLSRAVFIGGPAILARLATARDAGGNFPFLDCSARGGMICGIPCVSTRSSPDTGSLCLVDPGGIAVALDDVALSYSNQAQINMVNDPGTDTAVPVDLFSADLVCMKVTASANWEVQIPGSVSLITGGSW